MLLGRHLRSLAGRSLEYRWIALLAALAKTESCVEDGSTYFGGQDNLPPKQADVGIAADPFSSCSAHPRLEQASKTFSWAEAGLAQQAGGLGAGAGIEIDGLGGSMQTVTGNFYLFLS